MGSLLVVIIEVNITHQGDATGEKTYLRMPFVISVAVSCDGYDVILFF